MRRAYVVVSELPDGRADDYYAICHSMERADALCAEAQKKFSEYESHYTWYEVIEEDDE